MVDGEAVEFELTVTTIRWTPTARQGVALSRRYRFAGAELSYPLDTGAMADGRPAQNHLTATPRPTG